MTTRIAHYDLIETLGDGPNGPSHLAVDTIRDRMVVLRRFRSLRGVPYSRFEPLAHALADVRGPELAPIYALSPESEDIPYVTREYVSGLDLDSLRAQCALPMSFAVAIAASVARAIASLHEAGQAHGNLKPSNVFVLQSGGVRVTDPAIPGRLLAGREADVASGRFGDPRFMGPDQALTGQPSARGDVHALGVLLHQLLTGSVPFSGEDPASIRDQALRGAYPALPSTVPPGLGDTIEAALPRKGHATTLTAADVADRLTGWLAERGTSRADALAEGAQAISYAFLMANVRTPTGATPELAAPPARAAAKPPPMELDLPDDPPPRPRPPDEGALELLEEPLRAPTPPPEEGPPAPAAPPARERTRPRAKGSPARREPANRTRQWGYTAALVATIGLTIAWATLWHGDDPKPTGGPGNGAEQPVESPAERLQAARDAAAALDQSGEPAQAVYAARRALEVNPDSGEAHLLLGKALLRAGEPDQAGRALEEAMRLLPGELEPQRLQVEALLARGLNQPAVALARKALTQHGSDADLHKLIARGELGDRRFDAAIDALDIATRLAPEDAATFYLLGETLTKQGDHAAARDAFRSAIRFRPNHGPSYAALGRSLLALGQGGEAADVLAQGLRLVPDSDEVRYAVGRVMLADGRHEDAIAHLDRYTQSAPGDWRGWFGLGLARLRGGDPQRAEAALERAAALRPNQPEIHYDLGVARVRSGEDDAAIAAFDRAIKARYDLWLARCERAKALFRLGRHPDAREAFAGALRYHADCAVCARVTADLPADQAALLMGLPCGAPDLDIRNL